MILVGDIGGTKVRLALFTIDKGIYIRQQSELYLAHKFQSFELILQDYLKKYSPSVNAAVFGVPGPVLEGEVRTTNLPWLLREKDLSSVLSITQVRLINDIQATIASIPYLDAENLVTLYPGKVRTDASIKAVIAPGTGLGQGFCIDQDGINFVCSSEGGHTDFGPTSKLESELAAYLRKQYGRVSYERILSGPGLHSILSFLRDTGRYRAPEELQDRLGKDDPAKVIAEAGLSMEYVICAKTLELFFSVLGAQAGNLVLTYMATGGVYIAGGIVPRLYPKITESTLLEAYLNKGRLTPVVERTSLYLIMDPYAPLLGAAVLATEFTQ
jgi:glucokinase